MLKVSVTTYVMEVSVASRRGQSLAYLDVMKSVGAMLCLSLNRWVHWSHIGLANLGLLLLVCFGFLFFPESPAYLLLQKREETGQSVLQRLRAADTNVEVELQWMKRYDTSAKTKTGFLSLLQHPTNQHMVTLLGLSTLSVFSGSAMIACNGENMLLAAGSIMKKKMAMAAILAALSVGSLALVCLVDRLGRRFCLLLSLMILALAYSVVGAMDYASVITQDIKPLTPAREESVYISTSR